MTKARLYDVNSTGDGQEEFMRNQNKVKGVTAAAVMPPAPELLDKIVRTKHQVLVGNAMPTQATTDLLDQRTFNLIVMRPAKTRSHTLVAPTRTAAPVVGTRRALVLLVDFADKPATQSQAHFTDMLFSSGVYATGSMRDFYREASYNKLDVTGLVSGTGGVTTGWYRAPQPKSYYTDGNFGFNDYPKNAQKLVEDVIDLAAPYVNFADYDNDGDGIVDALIVICAGSGAEATGNTNDIWSHMWGIVPKTFNDVKIQTYFMAPEDGRVGVMAHELGHLLMGWPDLYDTDYSSAGTGRWDLMAGGSWNNQGNTPAHPSAWCKARVGWVSPTTILNTQQNVNLAPYAGNAQVYKLPIGAETSKEYFLLSNRQQTGFDSHLPGEGLLIEHVDENQSNNTDETHYLVNIEQADGRSDLNKNANRGDAGDAFPCDANCEFTSSSTPNSKAYNGADSQITVTTIQRSGDNVTATVKVGAAATWYTNRSVVNAYSSNDAQNAWGYIEGLGWRKVTTGATDGVTNTFVALCDACLNKCKVAIYADDAFIYRIQFA